MATYALPRLLTTRGSTVYHIIFIRNPILIKLGFTVVVKHTRVGVRVVKKMQVQTIRSISMIFLLLSCQPLYAEEPVVPPRPKLTVENINKTTEVLRDPTVIAEKMGQGIENMALPASRSVKPELGNSANQGELKDPTQMNQNFREALNRVTQNRTGTVAPGASIAPAAPALPKMSLIASVCGGHKSKNSAMLRINDKTEMVYAGDKITTFESNQVIEIQILDIHKHHVKVRVLPANETLILR